MVFDLWCVGLSGEGGETWTQRHSNVWMSSLSALLVSEEPLPRVAICFCGDHDSYRYSRVTRPGYTKVKPNNYSQIKKLVEAVGPANVFCSVNSETDADRARSLLSQAGLAVRLIMEGRHVETRRRSGHPCLAGSLSVATWR